MIINVVSGFYYVACNEISKSISNAYQLGDYINKNISIDSVMLSGARVEYVSGIIPYTNKELKYYHIQGERYFTYTKWDTINQIPITIEDIEGLNQIFGNDTDLYYIYCTDKILIENNKIVTEKNIIDECVERGIMEQLYETDKSSIYSENYIIYKVNLENI